MLSHAHLFSPWRAGITILGMVGFYDLVFVGRLASSLSMFIQSMRAPKTANKIQKGRSKSTRPLPAPATQLMWFIVRGMCLLAVLAAMLWFRYRKTFGFKIEMDSEFNRLLELEPTQRWASMFVLALYNLQSLFLPIHQAFDYADVHLVTDPPGDPIFWLAVLVLTAVTFTLLALVIIYFVQATEDPHRNRTCRVLFYSAWIVMSWLPFSQFFFFVGFLIADRVLYLGSVGSCLALADLLTMPFVGTNRRTNQKDVCTAGETDQAPEEDHKDASIAGERSVRSRRSSRSFRFSNLQAVALVAIVALTCMYAQRTILYVPAWNNEVSLFEAGLKVYPHNRLAIHGLGA